VLLPTKNPAGRGVAFVHLANRPLVACAFSQSLGVASTYSRHAPDGSRNVRGGRRCAQGLRTTNRSLFAQLAYGGRVGATTLRPATRDDVELLVASHADPEVSRYWDDETFTADQVRERLSLPDVDSWIVEKRGEPGGFLQSWREAGAPRRGGLDGFLVPAARGRGVMAHAARALARSLLAAGWAEVTVDPYAWNERAVRAWGKAGFVEVSRHGPDDEHTADWILMRFAP
jgi:RimJ/RimL family protein N-acetyltransferase